MIESVVDRGSFFPWDDDVVAHDPLGFSDTQPYPERLAAARRKSRHTESVITGRATINGRALALIAGHYAFMGGSVGAATGERVARAFERALQARLPVLAMTASGGTRMQEGSLAFVQMVKAAQAAREFKAAGLLYVVYLSSPTFGGVLASWGSLGHLTFGEPAAVVGFSGPRAVELTTGRSLPPHVQETDNLMAHGLIDDVFPRDELRDRMGFLMASFQSRSWAGTPPPPVEKDAVGDVWRSIQRSRHPTRPGAKSLLAACGAELTVIRGDGSAGGDDPGCFAALGRVTGRPCVVLAQDRASSPQGARLTPRAYRKARRAMKLAAELGLPLITVVDTSGVELSRATEEGGLSAEIARCLADLTELSTPTLSVLLGEGAGGGALAFFPADRAICAEHAWLLPIAPEGASAILYRSVDHAAEVAAAQGGASWDLMRFGLVDSVVAERPGWLEHLAGAIAAELDGLLDEPADVRRARRRQRIRAWGNLPMT